MSPKDCLHKTTSVSTRRAQTGRRKCSKKRQSIVLQGSGATNIMEIKGEQCERDGLIHFLLLLLHPVTDWRVGRKPVSATYYSRERSGYHSVSSV